MILIRVVWSQVTKYVLAATPGNAYNINFLHIELLNKRVFYQKFTGSRKEACIDFKIESIQSVYDKSHFQKIWKKMNMKLKDEAKR